MNTIKILFFGDLVGLPGCLMFQKYAQKLKSDYCADALIVNAENSADNGRGITPKIAEMLKSYGADMITTGNHAFQKKESLFYYAHNKHILRPINFPSTCPGSGVGIFYSNNLGIGVINVQGNVFMGENLSCPFRAVESALTYLKDRTSVVVVDMHSETTSEKMGLGWYCDGKVGAVVGTHTHVQTSDERILPQGTAFITDLGMAGAYNSMLGMQKESVMQRLLTQMPSKFEVEQNPPYVISGVFVEISTKTGFALAIKRFKIIDNNTLL